MKPYEWRSLALIILFGLAGLGLQALFGSVGEYIAYLICLPPPILYYVYEYARNEKPPVE